MIGCGMLFLRFSFLFACFFFGGVVVVVEGGGGGVAGDFCIVY